MPEASESAVCISFLWFRSDQNGSVFHSGIGSSSVGVSLGKGNPVTLDQNRVHFHCHVKRGLAEIPRALGLDCIVSAESCTVFSLDQIAQSASFSYRPTPFGT